MIIHNHNLIIKLCIFIINKRMIGMYRNQQITRKPKFSYATAQEYCELVKRSIDRVNSNSKKNGSHPKNTIKVTLKLP